MLELNLVVIRSANPDRAVTFYQALGLQFIQHAHGTGPEHYSSQGMDCVLEIYPLAPPQSPTTSVRLGLRVDDVDDGVARLAAIGAVILSPPKGSPWGRRAVVQDLDGHTVELTADNMTDNMIDTVSQAGTAMLNLPSLLSS
jgi:lactoylglutathione lyase